MRRILAPVLAILALLAPAVARANEIKFDSGVQLNNELPYTSAQEVANPSVPKLIYGKLEGEIPFDVYKFTADKDGEQVIGLLAQEPPAKPDAASYPAVLFIDPTDKSVPVQISLPLPDERYHFAAFQTAETPQYVTEPFVGQRYKLLSEGTFSLTKGETYYLIVAPNSQSLVPNYVLRFGTDQVWTAGLTISRLPSWFRVQTNIYAGTHPFQPSQSGWLLFGQLIGLSILAGVTLLQEIIAWVSNRSKSAGYLLVRMQPVSRILQWLSTLVWVVFGWLYISRTGLWVGVNFALGWAAVFAIALTLVGTLWLSPRVEKLEVTTREATIPMALRKRWFFFSLATLLVYVAIFLLSAMQLTAHLMS